MGDGDSVLDGVRETVAVRVAVTVGLCDSDGVRLAAWLAVLLPVCDGLWERPTVRVAEAVVAAEGDPDALAEGLWLCEADAEGERVGLLDCVCVADGGGFERVTLPQLLCERLCVADAVPVSDPVTEALGDLEDDAVPVSDVELVPEGE